jgi:MAF protein
VSVLARRLASAKARAVQAEHGLVLAADTVVADGDQLLGKPEDLDSARLMLRQLRGKEHRVVTALVLTSGTSGEQHVELCDTQVPMRDYSEAELQAYLKSGRALDKAGGYGIQDEGFALVDMLMFQGCFANVMGLPLCHLLRAMHSMGYDAPEDVPVACQHFTGYTCPVFEEILEGTA